MIYNVEFSDKLSVHQVVAHNELFAIHAARSDVQSEISEVCSFNATKTKVFYFTVSSPSAFKHGTFAKVWPL